MPTDTEREVIAAFGVNCPKGGTFYVCNGEDTEFVGCCLSNPHEAGGKCPDDDLKYTAFNKDVYDKIPGLECSSGRKEWYTCKFAIPPFMGCCLSNPCSNGSLGCPASNVSAAILSTNTDTRNDFLHPEGASSSSVPSASATNSSDDDGGLSTGAIVGIAVGAAAGALIVLGLLIWRLWVVPRK